MFPFALAAVLLSWLAGLAVALYETGKFLRRHSRRSR